MENMADEEGEIGSAIGGKTEGQSYHAHALAKERQVEVGVFRGWCTVVITMVGGARVGFMSFEMVRHVLHVRLSVLTTVMI